jgi:hypothetical protein
LFLACIAGFCLAQDSLKATGPELVERTNDPSPSIHEKFTVLKSDKKVKQGLFQAFFNDKTLVASGKYDKGLKVGIWRYCNSKGIMEQAYDYTNKKLLYAKTPDTSFVEYELNTKLNPTDTITYPVKLGATFYGYDHIIFWKIDEFWKDRRENRWGKCNLSFILSVSADGILTKAMLLANTETFKKLYEVPLKDLTDEDKLFVPATQNGKTVPSTTYVKIVMTFSTVRY